MALELSSRPTEPNPEALDIIDESPTNLTSRSLRYRRPKLTSNQSNVKKSLNNATSNVDNYSEFFRSDLQLDYQTEHKQPESNDCIDESPTNKTSNVTSRNSRLRSQNRIKIDKHAAKPEHEATTNSCENYSEFFKCNFEYDCAPKMNSVAPTPLLIDNSLEKYFNTSFESPTNENIPQNLNAMFQGSEFTQINQSQPKLLDIAITHTEDFADLSFTDFSHCTVTSVPNQLVAVPKVASQAIEWDDSSEFNDFVIPSFAAELAVRPQTELMVNDEVALGIDNVTFTQEFLPQRTVEKNTVTGGSQKTVAQFMSEEMESCIDDVRIGLKADDVVGSQQLNQSSLSNIVLNWSLENGPKQNVVETSNSAPMTVAQSNSKSLPKKNLSSIDSWGLSKEIVHGYVKKGIQIMFPWQVECLSNTKVGLLL